MGRFLAQQLNLTLVHVVCFESMLCLGGKKKAELRSLEAALKPLIKP
jgi:hypothetical protein